MSTTLLFEHDDHEVEADASRTRSGWEIQALRARPLATRDGSIPPWEDAWECLDGRGVEQVHDEVMDRLREHEHALAIDRAWARAKESAI